MKKNLKVTLLGIFIVLFTILFFSCTIDNNENSEILENDDPPIINFDNDWQKNENSIPYRLAFDPARYGIPEYYEYVEEEDLFERDLAYNPGFWVITSVKELYKKLAELNDSAASYNYTRLYGEYNESYFSENILILWVQTENSGSIANWIYSLDVNGETLTLNTLRFDPYYSGMYGTCDMRHWVFEIQVQKVHMKGITKVEMLTKWIRDVQN